MICISVGRKTFPFRKFQLRNARIVIAIDENAYRTEYDYSFPHMILSASFCFPRIAANVLRLPDVDGAPGV